MTVRIFIAFGLIAYILCTRSFPYQCTPEDKQDGPCTKEYYPVCGWTSTGQYMDAGNACVGCHISNVEYLTRGRCPTENSKKKYCSPADKRRTACTLEYMPHCGYSFIDGKEEGKTFGNRCLACIDPQVEYAILGECNQSLQTLE